MRFSIDTFAGEDVGVGIPKIDEYTLSDGDMYVKIRITDNNHFLAHQGYESKWELGLNIGCDVEPQKFHWFFRWQTQATKTFYKGPYDDSYKYLSFTGLDDGTYRFYISSAYAWELIDFDGTVYDDN